MSGINRLLNSENTINGNNQETLKEKLMDANNAAIEATTKGIDDNDSDETE